MPCLDFRTEIASAGSISDLLSILTMMRSLEESFGDLDRVSEVALVGSRTPTITMVFGRARNVSARPLPMPSRFENEQACGSSDHCGRHYLVRRP